MDIVAQKHERIFFTHLKYLSTSGTVYWLPQKIIWRKKIFEFFFKLNIFMPDVLKYFKYFL